MTWHLLGLKCISQVFSHCSSVCRSCCKVWESFLLVTVKYTAVSSANSLTCEVIFSGRSFMYSRNKIGPRTEPWGTPDVTGISDDFSPSRATHCERPSKLIRMRVPDRASILQDWTHHTFIGCRVGRPNSLSLVSYGRPFSDLT